MSRSPPAVPGSIGPWLTLCLALTGCGTRYVDCEGVPLGEPWKSLGLPLAHGRGCKSSADAAELQYVQGSVKDLEPPHWAALEAQGWVRTECTKFNESNKLSERACRLVKGTTGLDLHMQQPKAYGYPVRVFLQSWPDIDPAARVWPDGEVVGPR